MTRRMRHLLFYALLAAAWVGLAFALWQLVVIPAELTWSGDQVPLRFQYEGRDIEVLNPIALLLVLSVPVLWIIRQYTLSDLPLVQQHFTTLLRALVIAAMAIALSRVVFTTFESHVTTVFLVDVSASMPDQAIDDAHAMVQDAWTNKGEGNDVKVVTFAKQAQLVELTPGSEKVPTLNPPADEQERLATDIQGAMRLAYGLFPQDHIKRIVLISDGNQTSGDLLGETYNARDYGIKVFVRTFDYEPRPEVLVKDLIFPEDVKVGEPYTLTAQIYATKKASASLVLWQNDFKDGTQTVDLEPGVNNIEFKTEVYEQGLRRYRLDMTLQDAETIDTFRPNNKYAETIEVKGKPRVLYLEGEPAKRGYLLRALAKADIDIEQRGPSGIPTKLAEYENFDAVIMSDVPAYDISHGQTKLIDDYVRILGGGFIMAGGENSFGPGGYHGSYMEKLLPVFFESEMSRDQPALALALVIDKSGSMKGQKMELAKEAAKATVEILGKRDKVLVVAFDDGFDAIVPMQSSRNKIRINGALSRIRASGGTSIAPALQQAFFDLDQTPAVLKHVILLTDGKAPAANIFSEILPAMQLSNITVSTVSVGRESDRGLMKRIAEGGGGRSYFTADPYSIPKIFTKETSTVSRSQFVEEPFRPRLVKAVQAVKGINFSTGPYLLGYVSTKLKPGAELILASNYNEPILARWRRGLGKTAVFTSDVKNRWGVEWLRWDGYPKFWAQVLRDIMRSNTQDTFPMQLTVRDGKGHITVDAVSTADTFVNGLTSQVAIKPPEGDKIAMNLQQTAPGRYEADFELTAFGSYVVEIDHEDPEGDTAAISKGTLTWPYPDEYLTLEPNSALVTKTAEIGEGGVNPEISRLFDDEGESVKYKSELWPWFLFAAIAIWLLDVILRRLRLYGKTAIPWERVAGRS